MKRIVNSMSKGGSMLRQQNFTWDEAIQLVLKESRKPLHYMAIAQKIMGLKLREKVTQPENAVAIALSKSTKGLNGSSPYIRTQPGVFALRDKSQKAIDVESSASTASFDVPKQQREPSNWAIVELMTNVCYGGKVSKDDRFGAAMLQIEIPQRDGSFILQLVNLESVHRVTICEERLARAAAANGEYQPLQPWQLKRVAATAPSSETQNH